LVQVQFLKQSGDISRLVPGMNLAKQDYVEVTSEQNLALDISTQTLFT